MFNWFGLLLRTSYYFGHLIGVINFEVDLRTGRVFTRTRSTLYATASHFTLVIFIGWQFFEGAKAKLIFGRNKMYGYVEIILTMLWIIAGFTILLNQWHRQSQLMILTRNAIQLCLARPQIMKISRSKILFRFINCLIAYIFPFLFALSTIHHEHSKDFAGLVLFLWIYGIFNLAIGQYILLMVCIRGQYNLLNTELHQVIEESRNLSCHPSRKGVFMTKCCALADQLEDIAKLQSQLQLMVDQLDAVFGIPKLVMYCCYYAVSVVTCYSTFNIFKKNMGMNLINIISFSLWSFFFFTDAIHNLFTALQVQDGHQEMIRLLDERTLFASGLDVRLEESFESFQLQLIRNPLKMDVLQLFSINRYSTWAMFASILSHSICLVQYDLENFTRK